MDIGYYYQDRSPFNSISFFLDMSTRSAFVTRPCFPSFFLFELLLRFLVFPPPPPLAPVFGSFFLLRITTHFVYFPRPRRLGRDMIKLSIRKSRDCTIKGDSFFNNTRYVENDDRCLRKRLLNSATRPWRFFVQSSPVRCTPN